MEFSILKNLEDKVSVFQQNQALSRVIDSTITPKNFFKAYVITNELLGEKDLNFL